MLSKSFCGANRKSDFICKPGRLLTVWDYAEKLSARFWLEIQSEHFGNSRYLSIEGRSVEVTLNNSIFFLHFHSPFLMKVPHMINKIDNLKLNNQKVSSCAI